MVFKDKAYLYVATREEVKQKDESHIISNERHYILYYMLLSSIKNRF